MNTKIRTFEDLIVWQKAIAFVRRIYLITDEGGLKRDFGLKDQLRPLPFLFLRISLRFERSSRKEYLLFLNIERVSRRGKKSVPRCPGCRLS